MKIYRILIVDDEPDLCDIVRFNLAKEGYVCDTAITAEEALAKDLASYDLLLLDVMLPVLSGFELAEKIRQRPHTSDIPIIFLTAKDSEADKLEGFALGADDYVSKPFSIRELIARVKAVLTRTCREDMHREKLVHNGLCMDITSKRVTIDGQLVALTPIEFALLSLLMENEGTVFSRQELLARIWPSDVIVAERTVDVNITRLRKKIGNYASCVLSRPGFGYCFNGE